MNSGTWAASTGEQPTMQSSLSTTSWWSTVEDEGARQEATRPLVAAMIGRWKSAEKSMVGKSDRRDEQRVYALRDCAYPVVECWIINKRTNLELLVLWRINNSVRFVHKIRLALELPKNASYMIQAKWSYWALCWNMEDLIKKRSGQSRNQEKVQRPRGRPLKEKQDTSTDVSKPSGL